MFPVAPLLLCFSVVALFWLFFYSTRYQQDKCGTGFTCSGRNVFINIHTATLSPKQANFKKCLLEVFSPLVVAHPYIFFVDTIYTQVV